MKSTKSTAPIQCDVEVVLKDKRRIMVVIRQSYSEIMLGLYTLTVYHFFSKE